MGCGRNREVKGELQYGKVAEPQGAKTWGLLTEEQAFRESVRGFRGVDVRAVPYPHSKRGSAHRHRFVAAKL